MSSKYNLQPVSNRAIFVIDILTIRKHFAKGEMQMLFRIVVLIGVWTLPLVFGTFLIEFMSGKNLWTEHVLVSAAFILSLSIAIATTHSIEKWKREKEMTTSKSARATLSKIEVAIGLVIILGGVAFSLSRHPLAPLGVVTGVGYGGKFLIIGGALRSTDFIKLYHWLGWALIGFGALVFVIFMPFLGAFIVFDGLVFLGYASAEKHNQGYGNKGVKKV